MWLLSDVSYNILFNVFTQERVAAAVRKFEELHPPATEDCPLCHEPIRPGAWVLPSLCSRGEPYTVFPCCASIICKKCDDARIEASKREGVDEEEATCPLCHEELPPDGSEEKKRRLMKNAEEGHVASQVHVGVCLLDLHGPCDGFEVDKKEGLKWIKLAAEQHHPMAMFMLGQYYLNGCGGILEKSPSKALPLIEQAAKMGASQAHNLLGTMYVSGYGVKRKNESRGANHFTITYGLGICQMASFRLGMLFYSGVGGLGENSVLAKHYLEEASMKHTIEKAYFHLGDALVDLCQEQYDGLIHIPG